MTYIKPEPRIVRPLAEVNYGAALDKLAETFAPEWRRIQKRKDGAR